MRRAIACPVPALLALLVFAPLAAVAAAPPPAEETVPAAALENQPFGPAERAATLDRIAELIERNYVYKDKAQTIAAEVRAMKSDRELAAAPDEVMWATILTRRLQAHDIHFNVSWSAAATPASNLAGAVPTDPKALERTLASENYGFAKVERLAGNIGYIQMSFFAPFDRSLTGDATPAARKAGEAALQLVSRSDAVIFDLRQNMGGSPDMIDLLLSAFLGDKPVLLNRFYQRQGDRTVDFTTLPNYAGPHLADQPVFVLISGATASGAEEFAYDVQTQKRGIVVGERSAGGANPGGVFDAGAGLQVFISTGAARNPVTGTNWEGVGVKPDVEAPADQALEQAHALALQAVLEKIASTDPTEARWTLERLEAQRTGARLTAQEEATYVGVFGDRTVRLEDGALVYRRDRRPPVRMIPLGGDTFALSNAPRMRLVIEKGADGRASVLVTQSADGDRASFARTGG
ncbi:MAG: S41 family peptidase [Caulobacteraceae bacterium]|nr:S41 family peptidase [Caulobacteraceae bacterium]